MNTTPLKTAARDMAANRVLSLCTPVLASMLLLSVSACSPDSAPMPVEPVAVSIESAPSATSTLSAAGATEDANGLHVSDGWIRSAPPGAMMLAGYFTLTNRGAESRKLVGARSDAFGDVSIHRSVQKDGVSRMLPAGDLDVASGQALVFEPGGLHLMLMSPGVDVSAGQQIPLWLCFEDGDGIEEVPVMLTVGSAAPAH